MLSVVPHHIVALALQSRLPCWQTRWQVASSHFGLSSSTIIESPRIPPLCQSGHTPLISVLRDFLLFPEYDLSPATHYSPGQTAEPSPAEPSPGHLWPDLWKGGQDISNSIFSVTLIYIPSTGNVCCEYFPSFEVHKESPRELVKAQTLVSGSGRGLRVYTSSELQG